jgi:NTE family protein
MRLGRFHRSVHGAIVASHPENPVPALKAFWDDLTISYPFLPQEIERRLAIFGNPAFYQPRSDFFTLPSWTYLYDLGPIRQTLPRVLRAGLPRDKGRPSIGC